MLNPIQKIKVKLKVKMLFYIVLINFIVRELIVLILYTTKIN